MPAATTRSDLIAVTETEFAKLQKGIVEISDAVARRKRDGDTSIKDVIGHRAHWIGLFLGWYADGLAGKPVAFPAPGYKWSDLKSYNAQLRTDQAGLGWADACALLAARHAELMAFIIERTEVQLYGGPMAGANNDWTPGRWAEAAGASHYRSALKFIRGCLRGDAG